MNIHEPPENQKTFALATLGCKVNQYETQALRERLLARGWREVPFPRAASLYVVNTCVVTGDSDERCRLLIRRARRGNPAGKIVVTGCAAATDMDRYQSMPGVTAVFAREQMPGIADWLAEGKPPAAQDIFEMDISRFARHTRAFLKIQDGCDANCSYCIVPRARGPVRSRPLDAIRREAERLTQAGHKEIVLTGIHLGFYGRELNGPRLVDAARAVLETPSVERLRLSSLEGLELTDELIDLATSDPRFCPHFHIPLQSGDDGVLAAMRRRYTSAEFLAMLYRARAKLDNPSFTTDIIVGFPGETEEAFENTLRVCREAQFSRIHIFPFSPRPGTPAADMDGRIAHDAISSRVSRLKALADKLAMDYKRQFIGKDVYPLVEIRRNRAIGKLAGWTERYVRILFDGPDELKNRIIPIRAIAATPEILIGEAPIVKPA